MKHIRVERDLKEILRILTYFLPCPETSITPPWNIVHQGIKYIKQLVNTHHWNFLTFLPKVKMKDPVF